MAKITGEVPFGCRPLSTRLLTTGAVKNTSLNHPLSGTAPLKICSFMLYLTEFIKSIVSMATPRATIGTGRILRAVDTSGYYGPTKRTSGLQIERETQRKAPESGRGELTAAGIRAAVSTSDIV